MKGLIIEVQSSYVRKYVFFQFRIANPYGNSQTGGDLFTFYYCNSFMLKQFSKIRTIVLELMHVLYQRKFRLISSINF